MALHTKAESDPICSNDCFVGLLDVCDFDEGYASHLSEEERGQYADLPNQARRNEWLAGRLSAKYLFLNRLEMSRAIARRPGRPALSKLTLEKLGAYSPWMYQSVEVLANDGMPTFVWCGKSRPESVSLSHAGGVSCAAIGVGAPTAVDIETSVPRNEAFYRYNFSQAERDWATGKSGGESTASNWLFTFLWTLKESALKLGVLDQASLWSLPRIEIAGLYGLNDIEPLCRGRTMDGDFVMFTTSVKYHRREIQVRVAVTGTRGVVLTVMNPLIGASN